MATKLTPPKTAVTPQKYPRGKILNLLTGWTVKTVSPGVYRGDGYHHRVEILKSPDQNDD